MSLMMMKVVFSVFLTKTAFAGQAGCTVISDNLSALSLARTCV
jgi:hypothetical protein